MVQDFDQYEAAPFGDGMREVAADLLEAFDQFTSDERRLQAHPRPFFTIPPSFCSPSFDRAVSGFSVFVVSDPY